MKSTEKLFTDLATCDSRELAKQGEKRQKGLKNQLEEVVSEFHAKQFVAIFPELVKAGIAKKLLNEANLHESYPGFKKSWKEYWEGKISVYEINQTQRAGEKNHGITLPDWLEKAIRLLTEQGWECSVECKDSCGNWATGHLCVPDPRHKEVEISAI